MSQSILTGNATSGLFTTLLSEPVPGLQSLSELQETAGSRTFSLSGYDVSELGCVSIFE